MQITDHAQEDIRKAGFPRLISFHGHKNLLMLNLQRVQVATERNSFTSVVSERLPGILT